MKKFISICIIFLTAVCGGALQGCESKYDGEVIYIVEKGDTLWDIAEHFKPEGLNVSKYIYELRKLNGIGADIYPGQVITVPVANRSKSDSEAKNAD